MCMETREDSVRRSCAPGLPATAGAPLHSIPCFRQARRGARASGPGRARLGTAAAINDNTVTRLAECGARARGGGGTGRLHGCRRCIRPRPASQWCCPPWVTGRTASPAPDPSRARCRAAAPRTALPDRERAADGQHSAQQQPAGTPSPQRVTAHTYHTTPAHAPATSTPRIPPAPHTPADTRIHTTHTHPHPPTNNFSFHRPGPSF